MSTKAFDNSGLGFDGYVTLGEAMTKIEILTRYALERGIPIPSHCLVGPPGVGKTSAVGAFAKKMKADAYTSLPSACFEPPDFAGAMKSEHDHFKYVPAEWVLQYLSGRIKNLGVILMDDFGNAHNQVKSSALKFIHEKQYGADMKLDIKTLILLATNRASDAAGATKFITPLGWGRMMYHHVMPDHKEWLEIAREIGIHPYLRGYIAKATNELCQFSNEVLVGPCPRSWHLVSDNMFAIEAAGKDYDIGDFAGIVGGSSAAKFFAFLKGRADLVEPEEIVKNPETCRMPKEIDSLYMTTSTLEDYVLKSLPKHWEAALAFVSRPDLARLGRDIGLSVGLSVIKAAATSPKIGKMGLVGSNMYTVFTDAYPEANAVYKAVRDI